MSGGGGKKTKTETKTVTSGSSGPWEPAQPGLKYGISEANRLYRAGIGAQPYTASMVVPYADQTTGAMNNIMAKSDMAQEGMIKPFNAMSQQIDRLSPIARGDFSNDSTFKDTLGAAQRDARYNVDLGASAAGRYGSAVHQGNVAREVGELTNRAMLERQRWAQDGLMNAALMMPQAYETAFMPERSQMTIGEMNEDLMARQMQDRARIFNEKQNLPWDNLARYNAILSGAGALGNSGTSSSSVSQPRSYGSAFGNALTGYAYGGPGGALLGGLSGLF